MMLVYYYFRIMSLFLYFIPFEIIDFISFFVGNLIYISNNWRIKSIRENLLKIGITDFNLRKIFINMVRNHLDLLKFYFDKRKKLLQITDLENVDLERLKKDKYILLTAHYGNWELAGAFFGSLVKKTVSVAEFKGVGDIRYKTLLKFRSRTGMRILPLEELSTVFEIEKYIEKGYITVLLFDRDINDTGMLCEIDGVKLYIPKGPFYFSKKFDLDILLGVFFYVKNKKYRYSVKLVKIDRVENLKKYAENGLKELKKIIQGNPEEWFAFLVRWE